MEHLRLKMTNRKEISIFLISILFFGGITFIINVPYISKMNYHFGGEYGNIAASIISGKGYANTFGTDSGPTAWMPPFYSYLLAAIFWLLGVKTPLSAYVLLYLKAVSLSLVAVLLYRICKTVVTNNRAFLIIPIYLFLIFYSLYTFFYIIHDIWINMLLITLLFYEYCKYIRYANAIGLRWVILSSVALLTNPILGAIFLLFTFIFYKETSKGKKILIVLSILIICSPWFIRNYLLFRQPIPVKSNLFFDLYQGNYFDDDGILDSQTFINFHPFLNEREREKYTLLGEKNFIAFYRAQFFSELRKQPMTYIKNSGYRFLSAFLIYPSSSADKIPGLAAKFLWALKIIVYPIPCLLSIFFLMHKKFRKNEFIQGAIIIFFLYLIPYIFVGFYRRYRIPLTPIFTVFYFYFFILYLSNYFPSFYKNFGSHKNP
jgi:hypothetical protein